MPAIDKRDALEKLRKAKGAHIKWRAYAQALVSGVAISDDNIPVEHTDCAFGKWYYGAGRQQLCHLASYEGINTPHEMLHAIYKRIFDVLHSPPRRRGLRGLFSTRFSREAEQMERARYYMEEMVGVSETLLRALDILEQEIRELPEN
jgi:hypothetical protein